MFSYLSISTRGFRPHRWLIAIIFVIAAASLPVVSQTNSGRISGTVLDSAGAAVPGAAVTVSDPSTSFKRTATTDESGFYTVTNIPVGNYTVTVEKESFKR